MKKTLFSVIAGLAVIGSASAIPTPKQAEENCERMVSNGTHVGWCEKYKKCVEINPCTSDSSEQRKLFCKEVIFKESPLYLKSYTSNDSAENERITNAWIRAFMEFSHGTMVKKDDFKFADKTMFEADNCIYKVPVETQANPNSLSRFPLNYITDALLAYGFTPDDVNLSTIENSTGVIYTFDTKNIGMELCENVKDTANLLSRSGDELQDTVFISKDNRCELKEND